MASRALFGTNTVTVEFDGLPQIVPFDKAESVAEFKVSLASVLLVPPEQLDLRVAGAAMRDDDSMGDFKLGSDTRIAAHRVVSLSDALRGSAALLAEWVPKALYYGAVPAILYFALRRRGLSYLSLLDLAKLPFTD